MFERRQFIAGVGLGALAAAMPAMSAEKAAARWGEIAVVVNLGDIPRIVAGRKLAPYGWWIEGPGLRSAHLDGEPAFVESEGRRFVHNEVFESNQIRRKTL